MMDSPENYQTNVRAPSEMLPHLPMSTHTTFGDESSPRSINGDHTNGHSATLAKPNVDAQGRTLNPRSCVTCRKRKVKCDKLNPCSNCNRAHIECIFPAPGRAPRKMRKPGEGRDKELLDRLRRLEGVVKGLGVDPEAGEGSSKEIESSTPERQKDVILSESHTPDPSRSQGDDTSTTTAGNQPSAAERNFTDKTRYIEEYQQSRFENRFGRLVINEGKSRYINNSFWANLSNEVEDLKGILNQSSDEDDDADPGTNPMITNHQGWTFGFSSQSVDMLALHPIPSLIGVYWEVFKDRVDPLVKVLHLPTVEATVLQAASHLGNLSRGFEALLFAIYYGAVTALSAPDCLARFQEEKSVLLSRYRFAVEQALARASFLTTEEAVVLQGFVIFLICLRRNHDARVIWTLTGLVVRIAQTIGIHRDGSHFGLSPFEVEMRRRLWWQVCILDIRASEDHGCDPTIVEQAFDTKMPLNINDSDISPDSKEFPTERQGCTDMSFCLIRFEVANTFRRINYVPPGAMRPSSEKGVAEGGITLQDKEKWITQCHQKLEERYLAHCDMSVPLFWVTATVARLMMSKMWLMVYHPFQRQDGGASLPSETRDKLFITSLENIEYALLLETEARTMKWGWLFRTYMQWHALAFMLSELCHRSTGDLVERAWVAVEKTRDCRWGRALDEDVRAGHLWRPLKKLYRKAKEARRAGIAEEMLRQQNGGSGGPQLTRTYSPNTNPMFGGHPKRPTVTRAPLSNAQVQRFVQGPVYGEVPLDKHEMLKSPRLSETVGGSEVDPMDMMGVSNDLGQPGMGQQSGSYGVAGYGMPRQNIPAPTAMRNNNALNGLPPFANNFVNTTANIDYNFPLQNCNNLNQLPMTNAMDLTNPSAQINILRMDSVDSNNPNATNGYDPTLDASMLDASGEVNWENWDEMVRQFGMDIDTTFDRRPGDLEGAGLGDGAAQWNMAPGVGVNGGMGMNGGGQINPVQGNLRMATGMGMGGGGWF
ncbi:hypothetical protein LTR86_008713 [Recurvomyces mirabilis]|nr:hypothetical protein LTR86_008713 [Recurvomyces mirabilis]